MRDQVYLLKIFALRTKQNTTENNDNKKGMHAAPCKFLPWHF